MKEAILEKSLKANQAFLDAVSDGGLEKLMAPFDDLEEMYNRKIEYLTREEVIERYGDYLTQEQKDNLCRDE